MINGIVRFPLFAADSKPLVQLDLTRMEWVAKLSSKLCSGEYARRPSECLCGLNDGGSDRLIARKDKCGVNADFVLCRKCGLVRSKEVFTSKSNAAFYANEYKHIYHSFASSGLIEKVFASKIPRGEKFVGMLKKTGVFDDIVSVFEAGCAAGGILYPFLKEGKRVSGCDQDESFLEYGRRSGLDLKQGWLGDDLVLDGSQDLVILSHVMEHFIEPVRESLTAVKKIKPGKYMLVEVPGVFWIDKNCLNPFRYFEISHAYNFYKAYLEVFFRAIGLEILYGDEQCLFILRKPVPWKEPVDTVIYDEELAHWTHRIERYLKLCYLCDKFKIIKIKEKLATGLDRGGLKKIMAKGVSWRQNRKK